MVTATISKDATVTWTMPDGSTVTTMPQGPVAPTIKHRDSRWAVSIAERRKRRESTEPLNHIRQKFQCPGLI